MRIIAGKYRRRRLTPPPDADVSRPMPDRVKEAVFNLLRGHVEGESVADLFAGVGTMGLEALSRGAARVVMFEKDRKIAGILRRNADTLGVGDEADIACADALGAAALPRCPSPLHVVFYDPPYALVADPARRPRTLAQLAALVQRLDPEGYAVFRTPWPVAQPGKDPMPEAELALPGAVGPETHVYGSMAVHLYMKAPVPTPTPTSTPTSKPGPGRAGEEGEAPAPASETASTQGSDATPGV